MTEDELIREQLKEIPYKLLASELGRRNSARAKFKGRTPKLAPCLKCQKMLSARQRRKKCPEH